MTESMGFEAEVGLDVAKAIKSARELAGSIAKVQDATGGFSKELDKAERSAITIASAMQQFAKSGNAAATSATKQAGAIRRLVNEYNSLSRAQGALAGKGAVNQQNPLLQQRISALKQEEQYEKQFSKMLSDEQKARAQEAANTATAVAQERQRIEDRERQRELAGYRTFMQEKAALEAKNAADISRVWAKAQSENRAFDVNKLAQAANGQSLRGNISSDLLGSMRGTAEYTALIDKSTQGLANQRYALYDVATTFGLISTATLGAATAATVLAGRYDQAFAQVARTTQATGAELQTLRDDLIGITTDLPTSFADVTQIATLGAQMNIASENLAGFTETVSQFSATTDVTVDKAAIGFGRLAQLTQTPQDNISNLGSAIYEVGVNSVATEGEILSVAEQIATAGNLAGFSVQQIIALSSTLASLGVAPEQSRGAIMRIFGDITAAAGEGEEAVAAFAQTANMSAADFSAMWSDNPQAAFQAYLDGLSKMDKALVDVTLKQQGFINVRDRNVITRLANNMDVYTSALSDSSRAYAENTALTEGAAIANDNLIDNLTRLGNIFKGILTEGGQSGFLNTLVKGFADLLEIVLKVVQSPIGGFITATVTGLAVLVGSVAAVVAGLALGRATLLAMITAMEQTAGSAGRATLNTRALALELIRMGGAGPAAAAGLNAVAGASTNAGGRMAVLTAQARAASGAMVSAGNAGRHAGMLMKGALAATGIGLALIAIQAAWDAVSESMKTAEERAASYLEAMGNVSASGLSEAIAADTAAAAEGGKVYREYTAWVGGAGERNADLANSIRVAAGAQGEAAEATAATNAELDNQTRVLGETSNAWLANALASDENIQKLWEQKDLLNALGFDLKTFVDETMASPNGGSNYFKGLLADMAAAGGYTEEFGRKAGVTREQFVTMTNDLQTALDAYQVTVDSTLTKEELRTQVLSALGVQADETADDVTGLGDASETAADKMSKMVDASMGNIGNLVAVQNAVDDLGASLGENGNSFDAYSEAGRSNLEALQNTISAMADQAAGDSAALAGNLGGLIGQLQQYGVDTGNELSFVGDMLNQLVGNQWGLDFNSAPARADIQAFINDAVRAIQMRAALERAAASARAASFMAGGNNVAAAITNAAASAANIGYQQQINSLKKFQGSIATSNVAVQGLGKSMQGGFKRGAAAAKKAADSAGGIGDKAKEAQKEVRTLADYASDLESVWKRAFDIRYGPQQAADATASALQKMRDEIKANNDSLVESRLRVRELNAELAQLRSDNKTLKYQLTVAVAYGDNLRAEEIRSQLAKNNTEIAKTEADKAKEQANAKKTQDSLNMSLTGNSEAARGNRDAVLALVQSYQSQIAALAASGASTQQLERKTEELRADFVRQLTQMGYNRTEVGRYARSFDDLRTVIQKVPRNVTVRANTNPAQQAINEFLARNANRNVNIGANVATPRVGDIGAGTLRPSGVAVGSGGMSTPAVYVGGAAKPYAMRASGGPVPAYHATGGIHGMHPGAPKGTDTTPAWLTPGEFVHQKKAVDYYGLPFMNAINNMQLPMFMATGGSAGGQVPAANSGGVQLVEILPSQMVAFARAVSTQLVLDGKVVADSVNRQNKNNSVRGNG